MVGMSEKSAPLWLKVLTVIIAVGLASGYVVYRKNMAKPPLAAEQESSNPTQEAIEETVPDESPVIIMGSSKSGAINIEEMTPEIRRALMSSSKSGLVLPLPEEKEEGQAQQKPERTIMPSSKYAPTILPGSKSFQLVDPPEPEEP